MGPKLASEIPVSSNHTSYTDYLINTDKRFQFTQTNNDQVFSVLSKLCKSKATGLDQISARLVRECADLISSSITNIFNLSLLLGTFPEDWKCAKVTPIFKQGTRNEMNNYRPISVISVMAKAFERIIHNQLYAYMLEHDLLSEHQSGMYADDTNLTYSGSDTNSIQFHLNEDLENINEWLISNKLTLNMTKTEYMLIGSRQRLSTLSDNPSFEINGIPLDRVSTTKSLGVLLDENLTWSSSHINKMTKRIASEGTDKVMDGNNGETQKLVEELNTEILTTSTAAVKAKLSKDSSAKLHGKRDKIMEYCRYKFPNFPKDKPLRRITRSGGKSANEKLASDIIALVKYCCSEEITVEINELFKKSSSVHPEMSFSSSQGQKITNCTDIDQFTSLAENLDIKLCTLREDFDQTVTCLKDEISELKSDLCAKQAKIQALESELATFKGNCKSSLENTKAKLESCEIELNKNEENIAKHESNFQKLSKDLEKLRKETKEIGKVKSISKNPLAITIENQSSESNKNIYVEAANTILSSEEIKTKKTDKAKSIRENSLATTIEILSPEAN
ncbi:Hypothetical predicted protein [Paramuricea clavata]|uniref:Uncharacterized protein n=1 Tax=Paramuricea clavata TaxID=317549 RepID=A0A7D9J3I7_PARCT|nr:Hypothetical predicted protein [Paramuricea clavata]